MIYNPKEYQSFEDHLKELDTSNGFTLNFKKPILCNVADLKITYAKNVAKAFGYSEDMYEAFLYDDPKRSIAHEPRIVESIVFEPVQNFDIKTVISSVIKKSNKTFYEIGEIDSNKLKDLKKSFPRYKFSYEGSKLSMTLRDLLDILIKTYTISKGSSIGIEFRGGISYNSYDLNRKFAKKLVKLQNLADYMDVIYIDKKYKNVTKNTGILTLPPIMRTSLATKIKTYREIVKNDDELIDVVKAGPEFNYNREKEEIEQVFPGYTLSISEENWISFTKKPLDYYYTYLERAQEIFKKVQEDHKKGNYIFNEFRITFGPFNEARCVQSILQNEVFKARGYYVSKIDEHEFFVVLNVSEEER